MSNITLLPSAKVPLIYPDTNGMTTEWYRFFWNIYGFTGTGVVPVNKGGTGLDTIGNHQLIIGNANNVFEPTTLVGNGITITYGTGTVTLAIGNSGVTPGTYGSASKVGQFTVDVHGTLVFAQDVNIAIDASQIISGTIDTARISGSYTGITGVGTLTVGTWNATTIGTGYGGTGQTSFTNGQLLIGNTTGNTLTKATLTAGTAIGITNGAGAITITNTLPDQTVVLSNGTGISVTGTYPSFTITNTAPSSGGTVTSVTGTSPVVSSGGTTPAISLATAYGDTLNPYASKTANYFLAAPNGSAGVPIFRAIVAADIPSLSSTYIPYTGASSAIDLNAQTVTNIAHLGLNSTAVPDILLRAYGDNNSTSRIGIRGYSSNASSSSMRVAKFRGTFAAPQAPLSGDSLGKFELAGYGTTSSSGYPQASYEGVATENWSAIARGTKALFYVTPNTTITQTVALTIDQDAKATFANTVTANGVLLTGNTGTVTSVAATAGTGISVSGSPITTSGTLTITNTAPDQTVSLTAGTGISTSGTYPNFTITNTSPSSGGTVTSVTGTAPVVSSGGTTPAISMAAATTSVSGYLTSTDWNTFNGKGSGTVTSITSTTLTVGGTSAIPTINLTSGIVTAGTTGSATLIPVITVDTYGRVTSITTAANPQGTVTSVAATVPSFLSVSGSPITTSGTLAISYSGTALPILNGGTGQTTASAAFNALSPLTTAGDVLYGGTSGAGTRLAIGTAGQVLTVNAGATAPQWSTPTTGTVTSVAQSFTGGIISVSGSPITTSGTLALTVAGTSGGIPYFSSATTWATSAVLAANSLVIGGGAGVAPSTITTGTGVVTALGVNTGSAGAFVVNGGALGTPSSGTVTNLTGTASININGTVGATTPAAGTFTSLTNSGLTTGRVTYATTGGLLTDSANLTFNGTTLTTANDASISGLKVGKGSGSVSTNTALGLQAINSNSTGAYNTAIGYQAYSGGTSDLNTAVGYQAVYGSGANTYNTGVGAQAIRNVTSGSYNSALGVNALITNLTGSYNVAVGVQALQANTASNSTAVGYQAGYSTTSGGIDALGYQAGYTNSIGANLVAIGTYALRYNTSGTNNSAVGVQALQGNTTASSNTGMGYQAGLSNQTGAENAFFGAGSGQNTTGSDNAFIGAYAGRLTTSGAYNTALGATALYSNTTASYNTAVGYQAGYTQSGASTGNSYYGYQSGYGVTTGTYNVILGSYQGSAAPISATGSNFVVLSDGQGNIVASTKTAQTFALQGGTLSAGTGIAFPATQSASTDANTLDDYEEGTWTPTQGGNLTVVGTFSSSGTYTKIGRMVVARGQVLGSTSVAFTGGAPAILAGSLPFSAAGGPVVGNAVDNNFNQGIVCFVSGTNIYGSSAITATAAISFGVTYFV